MAFSSKHGVLLAVARIGDVSNENMRGVAVKIKGGEILIRLLREEDVQTGDLASVERFFPEKA